MLKLRQFGLTCPSLLNYQGIFRDRKLITEREDKKNEASGNSCLQIQTQWTALVIGKPVTSEEGNSHLVSPSSCVGQAVFGLIPAPWALAVFCAHLQTKSKGHFSRYYKSAVKTRQRVILLFLGLLVSSFLPLLVFSYLSPNPFPIQRGGTQD